MTELNKYQQTLTDLWVTAVWVWEKLDGHKTNIAGYLAVFSIVLAEFVVGILEFNPDWMATLIKSVNWFAIFLGGGGATHKLSKWANAPKENMQIAK